MVRTTTIGLVGLAVAAVSGTTQADVIDMHFLNVFVGENVTIHHSSQSGGSSSTFAGRFDWTVNSPDGTSYGGNSFDNGDALSTFCSEITQSVTPGSDYSYTNTAIADMPIPGGGMGAFRAGLLQELFDARFGTAISGLMK